MVAEVVGDVQDRLVVIVQQRIISQAKNPPSCSVTLMVVEQLQGNPQVKTLKGDGKTAVEAVTRALAPYLERVGHDHITIVYDGAGSTVETVGYATFLKEDGVEKDVIETDSAAIVAYLTPQWCVV